MSSGTEYAPLLEKVQQYSLALVHDMTAAMAKQYQIPDHGYPLPALIERRISDPWTRMIEYVAPEVLRQIASAFEEFELSPWRAVTEAETSHVHFKTLRRSMSAAKITTTLSGLRLRSCLVTPDGMRRPWQSFQFDMEVEIDVAQGYLTRLLVLPK
jgi:hypothetical protein